MTRDELIELARQFANEHYPNGWRSGCIEFNVGAPDEHETLLVYPINPSIPPPPSCGHRQDRATA
jgi:hypothetical protein